MRRHQEGFEIEEKFHGALGYLYKQYKGFQSKDLKYIMSIFAPELLDGLFERRQCKRILRYIQESNKRFTKGGSYQSISFNGGTYEVMDNSSKIVMVGSTYFEWIVNGETNE